MSAGLALDRGLQLCQEGKVSEGMLWMAESLAVNPAEDRGFANVVRLNLAAAAPTTVQRTLIGHEHLVDCVACSPDGKTVATGTRDGTVRRRDAMTGEPVGQPLVHSGQVLSMAFSPGMPLLLATGGSDKSVRVWDLATGTLIGQPIPQPDLVNSVAFSADGRRLLVATDGAIFRSPVRRGSGTSPPASRQVRPWPIPRRFGAALHTGRAVRDHGRV